MRASPVCSEGGSSATLVLRHCSELHLRRAAVPPHRSGFPSESRLLPFPGGTATEQVTELRVAPRRVVGFVPFLGGLHEGHMYLVRVAKSMCDEVWTSVFLNPTQFQKSSDFVSYPMNIEDDIEMLRREGVSVVFAPEPQELYPHLASVEGTCGNSVRSASADSPEAQIFDKATQGANPFAELLVSFAGIDEVTGEGKRRPGFMDGIGRVVLKLFTLVRPTLAFFGQKDFLQTVIIKQLAACACMDLRVVICPTVRLPCGLCIASRNKRLKTEEEKRRASASYCILQKVEELYAAGERDVDVLIAAGEVEARRLEAPIAYLSFHRLADGTPILPSSDLSASGKWINSSLKGALPVNELICVCVAVEAAPNSVIVDNFVLSDTHQFGDLLPQLPNLPFDTTGTPENWGAGSVLFLRSKAMRVKAIDVAKNSEELRAVEGRDSNIEEEALMALLSRKHIFGFLLVDGSRRGMIGCKGYMLLEREEPSRIRALRLFISPEIRRQGFAEHFFAVCMLLLRGESNSGKLDIFVSVPRVAVGILRNKGFVEVENSASQPNVGVEMHLDVPKFISGSVLRPLQSIRG